MKIRQATEYAIIFDNNKTISFNHCPECCEINYADFQQVIENNSDILDYEFEENLKFEKCDDGFRFGDSRRMFFVPCYSEQNGYYSTDVDIYYDGNHVLNTECEFILA
jgi:hypothetical protein